MMDVADKQRADSWAADHIIPALRLFKPRPFPLKSQISPPAASPAEWHPTRTSYACKDVLILA